MTNFFLKLGSIDKKLLMPVIAFFLIMIMNIIDYYWKISEFYVILELYSRSISYTVAIIIPIIEKCRNKSIATYVLNDILFTVRHNYLYKIEYIVANSFVDSSMFFLKNGFDFCKINKKLDYKKKNIILLYKHV